jgi:hypothetical protein
MGALAVYLAWDAYLLALFLLLIWWQPPPLNTMLRILLTLIVVMLIWGALAICVGTYEAAYPLILVSPLALLLLKRGTARRWIITLLVWYLVPALNALHLVMLWQSNPRAVNYQSGVFDSANSIGSMLTSLARDYARHFVTGWLGGISASFALLAVGIGVLTFVVCWRLARREIIRPSRSYSLFADFST